MFWLRKTEKWVDDNKPLEVAFAQSNQQTQGVSGLTVAISDDQSKSAREAALSWLWESLLMSVVNDL